jgi:hypothetical protein
MAEYLKKNKKKNHMAVTAVLLFFFKLAKQPNPSSHLLKDLRD